MTLTPWQSVCVVNLRELSDDMWKESFDKMQL